VAPRLFVGSRGSLHSLETVLLLVFLLNVAGLCGSIVVNVMGILNSRSYDLIATFAPLTLARCWH
jgi:hypothetical protein